MKNEKQGDGSKIAKALEYSNRILSTLREPFLVLDKNLRVISANQSFFTNFEVTEKDTIGQLLPDLGNRQWGIPRLLQLLKEIIPEKKVVKDYEIEHKFEQIGEKYMFLNACQLSVPKKIAARIATGVIEEEEEEEEEELILMAIEDVTERRRLQEEVEDSEERFRRAFETARDGLLLVHKTEGAILNSNAAAQELLDYSQEEFLKMKLWEIDITEDFKDFQETASMLERDGLVHFGDSSVKTKKKLNIASDIFLMDKAKVIQCNIRDITEKKFGEEEVKHQLQLMKTITDNAASCLFMMDVKGHPTFMNPAAEKVTGYTLDKIKDKPLHDSVHFKYPDGRPYPMSECPIDNAQAVLTEMKNYEDVFTRKDGSLYPVICYLAPLTVDGKVFGSVLEFRDITEQKKMEQEIQNLAKFPEENTNPVYRVSKDGILLYANPASKELILEDQTKKGDKVPEKWIGMIKNTYDSGKKQQVEMEFSGRIFLFNLVPVIKGGYVNSYAVDITERRKEEEETKQHLKELEVFYKASTGREERILELKEEIRWLKKELGRK
ncbi:PAS domain S-box protein [Candidatus Omnitrophota bacterium]